MVIYSLLYEQRLWIQSNWFLVNYTYLCLVCITIITKKSPGFTLIHAFMIVALRVLQRGDFPEKRFHDLLVLHAIFDFFSVFQLWWFSYYYSGKVHIHEISRNSHLTSRFLKSFQKELWIFALKMANTYSVFCR